MVQLFAENSICRALGWTHFTFSCLKKGMGSGGREGERGRGRGGEGRGRGGEGRGRGGEGRGRGGRR